MGEETVLTQKDFAQMQCPCGEGKDEPMALHSTCHINSPLWPWYYGGYIRLECSVCHKTLAVIKVAKE